MNDHYLSALWIEMMNNLIDIEKILFYNQKKKKYFIQVWGKKIVRSLFDHKALNPVRIQVRMESSLLFFK